MSDMYYLYGCREWRVFVARFLVVVVCAAAFLYAVVPVYAHPGNTAADGCHYCWTNCDRYGVVYGERHCHGGGVPSSGSVGFATGSNLACTPTLAQHESWLRNLLSTRGGIYYLTAIIAQVAMERGARRE